MKQPGQFARERFRHPALKEYHPLLVGAVRAARIWKKDPSEWPIYRITFANNQQRSVLCERCRLKRRDAKKRGDSEALGAVIHLPTGTAANHENPDPGVQMPAGDSQTPGETLLQMPWRRPRAIIAATPFFMGIAALKFKSGDMEAMGKNLGGSVMLFLVPKIVEVIITWAAK